MGKLRYFNSQHLQREFSYIPGNIQEMQSAVNKFRSLLQEKLPDLRRSNNAKSDSELLKVMSLLTPHLALKDDCHQFRYLFEEPDEYPLPTVQRYRRAKKQNVHILAAVTKKLSKKSALQAADFNKAVSEFLYEERKLNNEDVYTLLRFALTGRLQSPPVGEIAEILGHKEVLARLKAVQALLAESQHND